MNARTAVAALAVLIGLSLTGCAGTADAAPTEAQDIAASTESAAEETPAPSDAESAKNSTPVHITAAGEVCDPSNMNDPICAAFYPDQVVLNITARSADFAGLSDAEKIERAHGACEGAEPVDSPIYKAGAIAYCNEFAPGIEGQPDRYARLIAFYQALGEDGAKAHFSDKTMPTPAELGY